MRLLRGPTLMFTCNRGRAPAIRSRVIRAFAVPVCRDRIEYRGAIVLSGPFQQTPSGIHSRGGRGLECPVGQALP